MSVYILLYFIEFLQFIGNVSNSRDLVGGLLACHLYQQGDVSHFFRQMELAQLPAHRRARACRSESEEYRRRQQRVEAMRAQLEETQRRQEKERLEEARQRLEQHWRVNNAVLRQVRREGGLRWSGAACDLKRTEGLL